MATISSSNSKFTISVPNLYPVAQTIQGYMVDDAFTSGQVDRAETYIGVDGRLSAGFVNNVVEMTVSLSPDSPSLSFFENWDSAQVAAKDLYNNAIGFIRYDSIGRKYTLKNGVLKASTPFPAAGKTLKPVVFVIVWESVAGEPI